jgi:Transposase, Mutator family
MRLAEGHVMSDTAMVPRKPGDGPPARRPLVDEQLADQLLGKAAAEGVELLGPDGLLSQVTRAVLERALAEEMTGHLGYDKHDPAGRGSGNNRNGTTGKTVLTDVGAVDLAVPRDRNGTFEPRIVRKGQTRLDGFNDRIIALYARGMTTRDIRAHLREMYDVEVSPDLISRVTDAVVEELAEWQGRPLDRVYPVVFIDALMIKIRVLSLILWSAGQEYAFSQQFQAGAAEHLAFEHLEPVDVALDRSGAVGQGQAVADGAEVAAQVGGEGSQGRQGVVFDGGDPRVEAVAVAAGHHRGEGPDVAGEPVEVGVAVADAA